MLRVGRREIVVTHPERVVFPAAGLRKRDLVEYYHRVAPAMLPHLRDRPINLQRFPGGIGRPGFFQQQRPQGLPEWIGEVTVPKAGGEVRHVVVRDAATLVYLANQNVITPHAWLSRADRLEHPDQMIFDLDPPGDDDPRVGAAALRLGALLAVLELPAFVKTSGSRGYHVTVPLDRTRDFAEVRAFAAGVAALLARQHSSVLTTEIRKRARRGRILVDVLRNSYGHTAVPPYAVRARPGAPVAAPIGWAELEDPAMHPRRFTLRTMPERLDGPDPWAGFARRSTGLDAAAARLSELVADLMPARPSRPNR